MSSYISIFLTSSWSISCFSWWLRTACGLSGVQARSWCGRSTTSAGRGVLISHIAQTKSILSSWWSTWWSAWWQAVSSSLALSSICIVIWMSIVYKSWLERHTRIIPVSLWDFLAIHKGFTAPFKWLSRFHHVVKHCNLHFILVSRNVFLKCEITTTNSQSEVSSLELNVYSLVTKEIEIILYVNDGNSDT